MRKMQYFKRRKAWSTGFLISPGGHAEIEMRNAERLINFINASPSVFHVVFNLVEKLMKAGYTSLDEGNQWNLKPGGKYFVTRNDSSVIAFRIPKFNDGGRHIPGFRIAAAHSDSPTFKIKENPEKKVGSMLQLNTEKYGGSIMATWFDRPLSAAGRVVVMTDRGLEARLVNIDRDLMIIPSVAIHMNRNANEGMKYMANVDTLPLFGTAGEASFDDLIAEATGIEAERILGKDIYLYNRTPGTILGAGGEFIASPKLDNLECAWALMEGLILSDDNDANVSVCAVFDNEEVGSDTRQGAGSNFLRDVLRRISYGLGLDEEGYLRMIARSFMISADNAHSLHPNHPEYSDLGNCPEMNKGIVIKYNANQKYTTDAVSSAFMKSLCMAAEVSWQVYANRSDLPGGSTLGSISNTSVSVPTVDIGLAQLAMHSAYETAGVSDLDDLVKVMTVYFG